MAKSIVLYGVFLGAFICFCSYVDGVGVTGIRYEALGDRANGIENEKTAIRSAEENLIRSRIKQIYSAEIGVREATGKNDGERVEEYLAVTQLGKGYAWCASFVSWVFAEAGFPQPRTPWSPSLFPKERVIWEKGRQSHLKPNTQHLTPATADVFGIYFANLKRIAHAGFVDEWGDKYLVTVEGNTNEAGGNEGDGVYRKRRLISSIYQVADWVQDQERGNE